MGKLVTGVVEKKGFTMYSTLLFFDSQGQIPVQINGLLMPVSLLRADNNLLPRRTELKQVFDTIVYDPPYGVRAGGRKSGGRKLLKGVIDSYTVPDDKRRPNDYRDSSRD
ncbi:tRNA modification 11 protein [Thalictrum thalictroides]|uniref:tRNA modification 11 protein n=1 Tax=Thalictrum thalictroides TaxID=46969 RepID=A0A7J6WUI1_THATH|nr:tRNA modification 11 protein [Thalictrum thalictroides]